MLSSRYGIRVQAYSKIAIYRDRPGILHRFPSHVELAEGEGEGREEAEMTTRRRRRRRRSSRKKKKKKKKSCTIVKI